MPRRREDEPEDLDDGRDALALSATENADLCAGCVKCCTYISIEVESPRAAWEYDQWIWALHHEGIEMYLERPERWFLQVETRCTALNEAGRCSIHGRHPVLCREYDPRTCERRYPLSEMRAAFRDAYELERWLERERPAHFKALMAYRKDKPAVAPPPLVAGFVALASVTAPAAVARGAAPKRRALR